jgi:protein-arginine kinase
MGVIMGLVEDVSSEVLNELLLLTLPAHLQTIEGREDDRVARNKMRSAYLRRKLENR